MPGGRQCRTVARGQALLLGCNAAEQEAQGPPVLCHMLEVAYAKSSNSAVNRDRAVPTRILQAKPDPCTLG